TCDGTRDTCPLDVRTLSAACLPAVSCTYVGAGCNGGYAATASFTCISPSLLKIVITNTSAINDAADPSNNILTSLSFAGAAPIDSPDDRARVAAGSTLLPRGLEDCRGVTDGPDVTCEWSAGSNFCPSCAAGSDGQCPTPKSECGKSFVSSRQSSDVSCDMAHDFVLAPGSIDNSNDGPDFGVINAPTQDHGGQEAIDDRVEIVVDVGNCTLTGDFCDGCATFGSHFRHACSDAVPTPATTCGNGVVDSASEQCDEGAANGSASSCCNSICQLKTAGTVCRPAAGDCDVAETCDGVNGACPSDAFVPSSTECRAAAGECDLAESCPGNNADCPADAQRAAGTTCTDDGNPCTADTCDGSSSDCQHAAGNAGTVCRAAAGDCDAADTCDGVSDRCPADGFQPSSVVCRGAAGECDLAESCPGNGPDCPADAKSAAGTACTDDGNACTTDTCDGSRNACQHPAGNAGAPCRAAAGECDEAEHCSGTSASCPPDGKKTGVCRPKAGACDVAESCDGMTDRCPTDGFEPDGTACDDRNACTTRDTCQAGACAGGPPRDCDDDNPCTDDRCDPATGCSHAANTAPCDDSNACTQADICRDGACAGTDVVCPDSDVCDGIDACDPNTGNCLAGAPPDCDDGVVCTADACDPVNGCTHTPIRGCCRKDDDCEDHDACTGIETCDVATGTCRAGAHLDCDDDDACTEDRCDAAQGCLHTENTAGCDDGNPCTADGCNAKRGCVHTPVPGCCRSD